VVRQVPQIATCPTAAAVGTPADASVLTLSDPAARHPIALVHLAPRPSAPNARAFLKLVLAATAATGQD
jgi:hypothetical protein